MRKSTRTEYLIMTHHDQLSMIVTDVDSSWLIESYGDSYRRIVTLGDYKILRIESKRSSSSPEFHPNPSLTLTLISPLA